MYQPGIGAKFASARRYHFVDEFNGVNLAMSWTSGFIICTLKM